MDSHQQKMIAAALALGIAVRDLSSQWRRDAVVFTYRGQEELVLDGRIYASLGHHADLICDDKHVSKLLFAEIGIAVAQGIVFEVAASEEDAEPNEIEAQIGSFFQAGTAYVCKPLYGTDGDAVGMHLTEMLYIEDHVNAHREMYATWLLEVLIPGEDMRIQAIGGELVAAVVRQPAFVIGDGK
ncbi:MAG TPA: hypothetical protein ENJ82_01025, partial [Bacteroidetes bacterium]|nr:hypothetical protein [Bacteroidota bacterium]